MSEKERSRLIGELWTTISLLETVDEIKHFLKDILKISPETVHDEACNLEHAFSDESIAKLNILLKLMEKGL